jgi:hypothetical protein
MLFDVDKLTGLCLSGSKNLRYIAFIENRLSGVTSYVGANCAKYFSQRHLPCMINLMEYLATRGLTVSTKHFRPQWFPAHS